MTNISNMKGDIEKMLTNGLGKSKITGKEAGKLSDKQIDTLRRYKEYYEDLPSSRGGKNKTTSVWNAISSIRRMGLFMNGKGVPSFEDISKEDLIEYARSMNNLSDKTQSRAKTYIRMFFKWLYGIKDKYKVPDVVDDPRLIPNITKNKKRPQDLLTQDEIKTMLDTCTTHRQRSIIMLSVGEGGMRSGEISSLNIGSLEFDEKGVKVWIEKSKSKERFVRLINAEPYLREYVNKEYVLDKNTPSNPLFYAIAGEYYHKRVRGSTLTELLQRIGKKAGIKKRIYVHLGRAINISKLNKKGMSAEISAKRFGITPATLRNVYLTIDDKDVDDVYCKLEGNVSDEELQKIKIEEKKLEPKICPRCKTKNPNNSKYCNCGMILDEIEAATLNDRNSDILKLMLSIMSKSPILKEETAKLVKGDNEIKELLHNIQKEYL